MRAVNSISLILLPISGVNVAGFSTTPLPAISAIATSPNGMLHDARGWAAADLSDAIVVSLTDDVEQGEVNLIKRDLEDERARMAQLTELLGGPDQLAALYETADLS